MPLRPAVPARWLACLLLGLTSWLGAGASEPTFSATLTEAERTAAGLTRLDDNEIASLNAQVAREVRLARLGDVVAFAGTFSSRRPGSEHRAAGLTKLTPAEIATLDGLVARALAERPVEVPPRPTPTGTAVRLERPRGEWHGEVTMMYGRGSGGRDFYGGSLTTVYEDHDLGFAAGVSISRFEGDGWYYGRPYSSCRPGWNAAPPLGLRR